MADDTNEGSPEAKKEFYNMSREEFQSKLYVWFEEKGVLSGLRTHLRHQMIDALKTTELGHKISSIQRQTQNISPKYQALNLLIAEYFLQQRYEYSLSVFSSEVPMLSSLPKFTRKYVSNAEGTENNNFQDIKFNDRDVWDILEALGLPTESDQAQEVYSAYQSNSTTDTLLVWLIRLLTAALRKISMGIPTKNKKIIIQEEIRDRKLSQISPRVSNDTSAECSEHVSNSPRNKLNTNMNDGKKKLSFKSTSANTVFAEERSSQFENKYYPETHEDNLKAKIDETEVDRIVAQLHDRMQSAFDHELEIARRSEWQKCRNMIERNNIERDRLFVIEREKLHKMENSLRKKMQHELLMEKQKLIMEEKINLIEMQRRIERELEVERNLLKNEYQRIIQNKSENMSGLINNQENSLKLALQAVEYQSNRFKEQETMLNNILQELEKKSKKELNESMETTSPIQTKDAACQTVTVDTDATDKEETKTIDKLKALLDIQQRKMDEALKCTVASVDSKNIPKAETVHKDAQTAHIKVRNFQTNTDENEHNRKTIMQSDFGANFGNKVFVSTASECIPNTRNSANQTDSRDHETKHSTFSKNFHSIEFDNHIKSPKHKIENKNSCGKNTTNQNKNSDIVLDNIGDGVTDNFALETLRSENVYLKAYNSQQRLQIQELISNHASMKKDVNNAHSEMHALSLKLTNLEKTNECIHLTKSPTEMKRIKSAPCSSRLKKESMPKMNGVTQERVKKSHSSRKTIVERILQHRKDLQSLNQKTLADRRAKDCDNFSPQTTSDEENAAVEKKRYIRHLSKRHSSKSNRRPKDIFEKIQAETSPTDDVVKEAKKRLKMLELESEAVDRSYQEFKLKQSENLIEALSRKLRTDDQSDCSTYRQTAAYLPKSPLGSSSEVLHRSQKYGNTSYRNTIGDNISLTAPQTSSSEFIEQMPYNTRQHGSPKYNVLRRVHEPTMIIDNSVLQNYIATAQKMSEYLTKNPKSFADSLVRSIDHKKRTKSSVTFNERSPTSFNRFMKFSDWDNYKKIPQVNNEKCDNPVTNNVVIDKDNSEKQIKALKSNSNEKYNTEETALCENASIKNTSSKNNSSVLNNTNSVRRKLLFQRSPDPTNASKCIENVSYINSFKIYTDLSGRTALRNEDSTVNDTISNIKSHLTEKIKSPEKTITEETSSNEKNVDTVQTSSIYMPRNFYTGDDGNLRGSSNDEILNRKTHLPDKIKSVHKSITEEKYPNEINVDILQPSSIDLPQNFYMTYNDIVQENNNVEKTSCTLSLNNPEENKNNGLSTEKCLNTDLKTEDHKIKYNSVITDNVDEILGCPSNLENIIELSLELGNLSSNNNLEHEAVDAFKTEFMVQNKISKSMENDIKNSREIERIEIQFNEIENILSDNVKELSEEDSIKNGCNMVKMDITNEGMSQINSFINENLLSEKNDNIHINDHAIDILEAKVNYLEENKKHACNIENTDVPLQEILSIEGKFDDEKDVKEQKELSESFFKENIPTAFEKDEIFQEKMLINKVEDCLEENPTGNVTLDNVLLKKSSTSKEESLDQQDNTSNKSVLSDVVLSEDNMVESSFELSNPSAISIPQISDDNESFWN